MFYARAFRGYAEVRPPCGDVPLVRDLGDGGIEAFCRSAERLGGEPLDLGNAGYAFQILPCIHLAAIYPVPGPFGWLGDKDLPSQASIFFVEDHRPMEDTASHYMSTDGLAVLGSHPLASAGQRHRPSATKRSHKGAIVRRRPEIACAIFESPQAPYGMIFDKTEGE